MKQEPLKRRRPAARKRGQKQTLRAVVLSVLAVSVIALCLGIWTRLPGEDVPVGGVEPPEEVLSPASSVATPEPEPEPQPVVETIRFSATGDNLIHSPIYNQAARRAGENFLKIKRPVSNVGVFIRVPFTVSPPPKLPEFFLLPYVGFSPLYRAGRAKTRCRLDCTALFPLTS